MPRMMVSFSDLSNQMVPQDQEATITIRNHPMLTEPIQLDAALSEVKPLLEDAGEFVVCDITANGETKQIIIELARFNALFKDDPYKALANGRPVKTSKVTGQRSNNSAELAKIREWCRENGWPDLKDKGRVPADAQAAYDKAHATAAS